MSYLLFLLRKKPSNIQIVKSEKDAATNAPRKNTKQ